MSLTDNQKLQLDIQDWVKRMTLVKDEAWDLADRAGKLTCSIDDGGLIVPPNPPSLLPTYFNPLDLPKLTTADQMQAFKMPAGQGASPYDDDVILITREAGGHYGAARKLLVEGDEAYFSFAVRLQEGFSAVNSWKMPGVSAWVTSKEFGGQGGGNSGGLKSWSFRMLMQALSDKYEFGGMGFEGYHDKSANAPFGETMWLDYETLDHYRPSASCSIGDFEWHWIKIHVKLNTDNQNDGVLRAWFDGRLAFERRDLGFTDADGDAGERDHHNVAFFMNVYEGGNHDPTGKESGIFFDGFNYSSGPKDLTRYETKLAQVL